MLHFVKVLCLQGIPIIRTQFATLRFQSQFDKLSVKLRVNKIGDFETKTKKISW